MTTVQGMKVIYKDADDKYIIPYTDVEYKLEKNYYTSAQVDEKIVSDLSDYYTKSETYSKSEVDDKLDNIETGDVDLSDYYTKSETYSKTEVNEKLDDLAVGDVDLSNYYTKEQVDSKVTSDLSSYYTSEQVDDKLGDIETILDSIIG